MNERHHNNSQGDNSQRDKSQIAGSFSRQSDVYAEEAVLQNSLDERICRTLSGRVPSLERVLDAGCGTGYLLSLLCDALPQAELTGVEIAPGMIAAARKRLGADADMVRWVLADLDWWRPTEKFDAVTCNYVLQWTGDPGAVIKTFGDSLHFGGTLVLAVPIAGSFCELNSAYQQTIGHPLEAVRLFSSDFYVDAMKSAGLETFEIDVRELVVSYPSAVEALRSFHRIGAVYRDPSRGAGLSVRLMRRLLDCYERLCHDDSEHRCRVTHRYLFAAAAKR